MKQCTVTQANFTVNVFCCAGYFNLSGPVDHGDLKLDFVFLIHNIVRGTYLTTLSQSTFTLNLKF